MPSIGVAACPTRVATSGATVDVPAIAAEPSMKPSCSHLRHVFSKLSVAVGTVGVAAAAVAGFEPELATRGAAGTEPVGTAETPGTLGTFVCQYSRTTS